MPSRISYRGFLSRISDPVFDCPVETINTFSHFRSKVVLVIRKKYIHMADIWLIKILEQKLKERSPYSFRYVMKLNDMWEDLNGEFLRIARYACLSLVEGLSTSPLLENSGLFLSLDSRWHVDDVNRFQMIKSVPMHCNIYWECKIKGHWSTGKECDHFVVTLQESIKTGLFALKWYSFAW